MTKISTLQPAEIWHYFEEISAIPRPSGNMKKIIEYLKTFGKIHHLETKIDERGNVLIKKPATQGNKSAKTVALQSHIDMVGEKNKDTAHNFDTDPIALYADGDWVKARGTTLGADNGIGVAAMLAVLASDSVEHGNLECLFTVDEEIGLLGALALKKDFLNADVLLNLDSEDDNELYIGCAGGIDTVAIFDYREEKIPQDYFCFKVSVGGLHGGHSGEDIDKGFGNANKILTRYLWHLHQTTDLRLCLIDGGNKRNAIAREAFAIGAVPYKDKEKIRINLNVLTADIERELLAKEPHVYLDLESETPQNLSIDKNTSDRLLKALYACPHGVIAMSNELEGLVATSTNLASVKMQDNNKIQIVTSQRSSIESAKFDIMQTVECLFKLAGAAEITHEEGYPGWNPNPNSEILKTVAGSYRRLFGEEPRIRAIHAGLECGLFVEKYPQLDLISFGPTILSPHSPNERVQISSVAKFWKLLLDVLKNMDKIG